MALQKPGRQQRFPSCCLYGLQSNWEQKDKMLLLALRSRLWQSSD